MKLALAMLYLACAPAFAQGDEAALKAATHDLCPREVAMLGESPTHGDGHTEAFKVALVQRLVDQCGFDAVFFEASHYEFLHIAEKLRAGQPVTEAQIAGAIGGLWKFDKEFQPILPFLLARAQSGKITLGGIDDQLGQFQQDYANNDLPTELAALLPEPGRPDCMQAMHRRIYWDYPQAKPYSEADRTQIAQCLASLKPQNPEQEESISAFQRWIARDFLPGPQMIVARDRSMYQNFTWLRKQSPTRHKVILWAATVHIAKQGDPSWGDKTGTNFGSFVHRDYGERAFSLGFSALTGSYRVARRDIHPIPPAPATSLEAKAFADNKADTVYISSKQLAAMATVSAAAFKHEYETLPWSEALDGIVIFREERPPDGSR